MSESEFLALEPRVKDAMVAEKFMNLPGPVKFYPLKPSGGDYFYRPDDCPWVEIPQYVSGRDKNTPWKMVDKMLKEGKTLEILVHSDRIEVSNHTDEGIPLEGWEWEDDDLEGNGETLGLALGIFVLKYRGEIV